jgi:hypothetical protein
MWAKFRGGNVWTIPIIVAQFAYLPFVLMNLWNWFITSALHASEISYFHAHGLQLILLVLATQRQRTETQISWVKLFATLDGCIREDKRKAVEEVVAVVEKTDMMSFSFGLVRLATYTLALGVGWGIH